MPAIVYEDGGEHELKGKAEPLHLFRAVRVIAGRAGIPSIDRSGVAVRRPRSRVPAREGPLPRDDRRTARASRVGARDRRDRQVALRVGVREVRRRRRRRRLLAPGPVHPVRRGRQLLGARRDGPDAGGIAEEEDPDVGAAKLADAVRRGSPMRTNADTSGRGLPLCSATTIDRGSGPRGPVGRLADVLRADRRPRAHDRPRLRGSPVGRRRASGLHPDDARSLARPAVVRRDALQTRAAGTAVRLGAALARLHLAVARAPVGRRDGSDAPRHGAGDAGRSAGADPPARGGHPALRGRDGPDAAGPRRAGPHRRTLRAGRRGRSGSTFRPRCTG